MNRSLPSIHTALSYLERQGCSKGVIEHCKTVTSYALEVAEACNKKGLEVDVDLVTIGAVLHDIGRSESHSVDHAVRGAQIAARLQLPSSIVSIIERHVGGGIEEKEAERLGWPVKSYVPCSLEEKIVAYADKLVEGSKRISIDAALQRLQNDSNMQKNSLKRILEWHKEFAVYLE